MEERVTLPTPWTKVGSADLEALLQAGYRITLKMFTMTFEGSHEECELFRKVFAF